MYQHIYFNVALQSAPIFFELSKAIPELYRWFKQNREVIKKHFTFRCVDYKKEKHALVISSMYQCGHKKYKLHTINGDPSNIILILSNAQHEKFARYEQKELNVIDYKNLECIKYEYYWHKDDLLHRDDDAPAHVSYGTYSVSILGEGRFPIDFKMWYQNGRLHRANDRPAIIDKRGSTKFYVSTSATISWYIDGQLKRSNNPDKPVMIDGNGRLQYIRREGANIYDEENIEYNENIINEIEEIYKTCY